MFSNVYPVSEQFDCDFVCFSDHNCTNFTPVINNIITKQPENIDHLIIVLCFVHILKHMSIILVIIANSNLVL